MDQDVAKDVAVVQDISAISSILKVVLQITGMGFAAVARVTEEKWVACQVLDEVGFGLVAGGELPIKTTLCDQIRTSHAEIIIDHVSEDPVYAGHHTPEIYGLQSYISMPIILADGSFFGTLCAIDPRPAKLRDSAAPEMFRLFASLIARHIDDQLRVLDAQAQLLQSTEMAEVREQFIAVLGHDLRNPIAALQAGTNLLTREAQSDRANTILLAMRQTTERMTALVENLLDFARGRMAGGIAVNVAEPCLLGPTLDQILADSMAANPARRFDIAHDLPRPVAVDPHRIGQLLANLLANAVAHGSPDHPIRVRAGLDGGGLVLSVANGGDPIPLDKQARLFQPFFRGDGTKGAGLGLGLYIATQIALAHDGRLDVTSDAAATTFTFSMTLPDEERDAA